MKPIPPLPPKKDLSKVPDIRFIAWSMRILVILNFLMLLWIIVMRG